MSEREGAKGSKREGVIERDRGVLMSYDCRYGVMGVVEADCLPATRSRLSLDLSPGLPPAGLPFVLHCHLIEQRFHVCFETFHFRL